MFTEKTFRSFFGFVLLALLAMLAAPLSRADDVDLGKRVVMTATADGTQPFTYQWQKGGVAISGATAVSYTIASFKASDAGAYSVLISNSAGSVTGTASLSQAVIPPSNPKVTILQSIVAWIKHAWSKLTGRV